MDDDEDDDAVANDADIDEHDDLDQDIDDTATDFYAERAAEQVGPSSVPSSS